MVFVTLVIMRKEKKPLTGMNAVNNYRTFVTNIEKKTGLTIVLFQVQAVKTVFMHLIY